MADLTSPQFSSGTATSPALGCASIPRARRSTWCRPASGGKRGASPSAATGCGRPSGREAGRLLASLKAGETPRRPGADSPSAKGPTIAGLAERHTTEHVAVRCKPATKRSCRHILDRFLLPRFGALRLSEFTPDHVSALQYRMRDKPVMANQTVSLFSWLFYTAPKTGEAPAGAIPAGSSRSTPRGGASGFCRSRSSTGWAACSPSSKPRARSRPARPGRCAC